MPRKFLTLERRNRLAQILVAEGTIRVSQVAKKFDVSTETIRKDLDYLERQGIAKKGHGGAIAASDFLERPFTTRSSEYIETKNKIARAAVELIPEGGVVILDPGTTTLAIARLISLMHGLVVITNSLSAADVLSGTDNKVYLTGGEVRSISMALVGYWALNSLGMINADIAFLGASSLKSQGGPYVESFAEVDTKRTILKNSKKGVVVSASNKFKIDALVQYATWEEIDILITDDSAPPDKLKEIERSAKVIVAK